MPKVYLKTKTGVDILMGLDAQKIIEKIKEDGDIQPYILQENMVEAYMAIKGSDKNSKIEPPKFPKPGSSSNDYGTTSSELYAKVVTYPEIVSRIIQLQTKTKPTLMDQIKKAMTLATPIVAVAFIIFIMAVALGG